MTRSLFRALLGAAVVLSMLAAPAAAQEPPRPARSDLLAELGSSRVQRHSATGQLRFVSGSAARPAATSAALGRPGTAQAAARRFMVRYGSLFGIADASRDLRADRSGHAIGRNTFVRYQQLHRGVPVLGGEIAVQVDAAGNVISASGEASPDLGVDVTPAVTSAAATRYALSAISKARGIAKGDLTASVASLWIYDPALLGGRALPFTRLVWRMDVTNRAGDMRELVLIDAARGNVALHFDQIAEAKNRLTCDANSSASQYPCTAPVRTETSGPSAVADVNNAHVFSGHTYDFFFNRFGRDSLDGAGMALKSTVRFCPDSFDCPYVNAFWDGSQMVYGAGFANADDVVGHELAHGVTDHTSSLFYYYQSGAINEALSDIFGEFMDLTNGVDGAGGSGAGVRWLLGEDLSIGAIRDMEHPPTFGHPDRMQSPNYWDDLDDNGGVHINSGVANKAAYLMTDGGSFNGQTLTPIGIDRAAAIWYRVEANYLGSASDYADLGAALSQACTDLVGSSVRNSAGTVTGTIGTSDCTQVAKAVTATQMSLQPTSADATAPDAPVCATGGPTNVLYDQIPSGAPGWTTSGNSGNLYGWYFGDWYATSPDYHLYGYMDTSAAPPAMTRSSATAIPANAFLHFRHAYEFEWYSGSTFYDGGVLEYSTNGGTSWTDAGTLPATNGYDGVIASGFGNPLQGRSAFVGISHGYMSSRYDLSSLSGQNVKFRFRVSSDSSVGFQGWYVDDFRIYTCGTSAARQPDGRIQLGTGAFVGDNVYNTTAIGQKKTGSAPVGSTIKFGISVQNDGSAADSFRMLAAGSTTAYNVKYKVGATDVTTAVVAGTYTTPSLPVGGTHLITVKVKVKSSAAVGSKVSRKVTVTSAGDGTKQDAVKFIGKRS